MHLEMYFHASMRKTDISNPKILLTNDTTSNMLTYRFAYSLLPLYQFCFSIVMQFIVYIYKKINVVLFIYLMGWFVIYANKIKI